MKSHASVLGSTLLVALFAVASSSPFTAAASSLEKQLKDLGDKLDDTTKKSVEDAIAMVREALKGNDNDAVII